MRRPAVLAVALVCLVGGCRAVTEIVVRVDTRLPVGASFTTPPAAPATLSEVCFRVEGLSFGTAILAPVPEPVLTEQVALRTTGSGGECLPIELGVVARGDWADRDFGIEVRGQARCSDEAAPHVYARAIARFTPDQVTVLPLLLEADCPTPCRSDQRCDRSGAVPICQAITLGAALAPYASAEPRCPQ